MRLHSQSAHSVSSTPALRHVPTETTSQARESDLDAREIVLCAIEAAIGQKAHDVRGIDLSGVSDIADYFVIASGNSDRHVKGIADKIRMAMKNLGEDPSCVSGYENAEWIILDYADVVVHIFFEPMRQFYSIDKLWSKAPKVSLPAELENEAKKLRTGMVG